MDYPRTRVGGGDIVTDKTDCATGFGGESFFDGPFYHSPIAALAT